MPHACEQPQPTNKPTGVPLLLQVFLTISILMGEGVYMIGRVLLSSECLAVQAPWVEMPVASFEND